MRLRAAYDLKKAEQNKKVMERVARIVPVKPVEEVQACTRFGGVKGDTVVGKTGPLCMSVTENRVHGHDLQTTMVRCLGLDHTRLTYQHMGRDSTEGGNTTPASSAPTLPATAVLVIERLKSRDNYLVDTVS
jgi:hypothetical protein